MTTSAAGSSWLDLGAMTLSGACLVHCLALPVLAISLPVAGLWADAEWLHQVFVGLAVLASGGAMLAELQHRRGAVFIAQAALGLALLALGAFVEALHDYETVLTVAGALILALAHVWRLRRH